MHVTISNTAIIIMFAIMIIVVVITIGAITIILQAVDIINTTVGMIVMSAQTPTQDPPHTVSCLCHACNDVNWERTHAHGNTMNDSLRTLHGSYFDLPPKIPWL